MSDLDEGSGLWLAGDGEWYPPQPLADWRREHLTDSYPLHPERSEPRPVPSVTELEMPVPFTSGAPDWWEPSDGPWNPRKSPVVAQTYSVVSPVEQVG